MLNQGIETLNVAGSRESEDSRIYDASVGVLQGAYHYLLLWKRWRRQGRKVAIYFTQKWYFFALLPLAYL
jgi:hypothetical protein